MQGRCMLGAQLPALGLQDHLMPHTPQHPCAAGEGRAVRDGEIRAKASRATSGLVATDSHTSGSM